MKRHYRGSVVDFEVIPTNTAGVVVPVTAMSLTVTHPLDGYPHWNGTHTTTYTMTLGSTVTQQWEYNWDSSPSAGGVVWWHMVPDSTVAVTKSGRFEILSNPAATWLHGPSTPGANDE